MPITEHVPRALGGPLGGAARELFPARNRHGVYAFGIGPWLRAGRSSKQHGLNVFVRRKSLRPRAPVPDLTVVVGERTWIVRPNVVATGRRPRAHDEAETEFTR